MKAEIGGQIRIAGLARSPDREGALAHLDTDRGFAVVCRGAMGRADVIDPTIWVREKLSLALSSAEPGEAPLRRLLSTLRALHGELVTRAEGERAWVSVLVLLCRGDDAVAVSAGDCPCFRYRSGLLSRLGRTEASLVSHAPRGALGSEPQVRIDVVPLRPQPGDLYILSTRPLREGELAVLARDLTTARDPAQLLRAGVEGTTDRGRLAIRILEARDSGDIAALAEQGLPSEPSSGAWGVEVAEAPGAGDWSDLPIEAVAPRVVEEPDAPEAPAAFESPEAPAEAAVRSEGAATVDAGPPHSKEAPLVDFDSETFGAEPSPSAFESPESPAVSGPEGVPSAVESVSSVAEREWRAEEDEAAPWEAPGEEPRGGESAPEVPVPVPAEPSAEETPKRDAFAPVHDDRPWYEPVAIWGAGALAIVALAFLVRALLPGILGTERGEAPSPAPASVPTGFADIFSDPPGAIVRVDGVPLEGRTPLNGVALDAGIHRVELDWGAYGVWRDTLEIPSGSKITVHPALFGVVSLNSSDPSRVLDVFLDGVYSGTTPLTLDRVVVGRHLVRFGGPGVATSGQEIEVVPSVPVSVTGQAGPVPQDGTLTVRTAILGDAGFESGKGDPFWIDGAARGATPGTVSLIPGTHSVRVARRGFPPQITVLDVKAGGEHFVTAEFGARSEEPLRYTPPDAFSIGSPEPVTLGLTESEWDPSMALWLYAAPPGGTFQAKRMTRLEEGSRTFAALLPPEVLRNSARRVQVYFKATGTGGREIYSEIYTVRVRD
jgi:hypothetical protein